MKRKIMGWLIVPAVGWVLKKVVDKVAITRQQHAAREKVTPAA